MPLIMPIIMPLKYTVPNHRKKLRKVLGIQPKYYNLYLMYR